MYRLTLVMLILLFFSNCSGNNDIPENILSQEKMRKVMWDMICADEFVTTYIWKNDSSINRLAESTNLYEQIFSIHEISRVQYQNSLAYYRKHPDMLKTIVDSLNEKQKSAVKSYPVKLPEDSLFMRGKILPIQ